MKINLFRLEQKQSVRGTDYIQSQVVHQVLFSCSWSGGRNFGINVTPSNDSSYKSARSV